MKLNTAGRLRLLVLIPHRDARNVIRRWSEGLFAAGMTGAGTFPWVVPLAVLSRPLSPGELRDAALTLREANLGGDGKIRSPGAGMISLGPSRFPGNSGVSGGSPGGGGEYPAIYGLVLNLVVPDLAGSAAGAQLCRLAPPVLGAALIEGPEDAFPPGKFPPPPETTFRAAALANMIYRIRPAGEGAVLFEWKTGKPRWLPSNRSAAKRVERDGPP
ncbi:MAG: hypothetical protein LBK27_01700 [Treponema sp.]|nr:hypothetical protein [Treponema sp.]